MVAVVLAEHNMAEYLDRCINSIISQTYKDLEIVIIDDGSTDSSAEIIKRFRQNDQRIKLVCQENKGHSEARNVGIANSKAEYLYFIDADDYIHPQAIETLMSNLLETDSDMSIGCSIRDGKLPEIDNHYRVFNSEKALEILTRYTPNSDSIPQFSFNPTWNRIFKRSLFDDIKFPTGHIHDDNFTCHRLLGKAKRIVWTNAITYFYQRKPHSMSEDGLYANKDLILAHQDRIAFLKEQGFDRFLPDACSYYLLVCYKTFQEMNDYSIIVNAKAFIKENKEYIMQNYYGQSNINSIMDIDEIIIYTNSLTELCGLYMWTVNFVKQFENRKIRILSRMFQPSLRKELEQFAECEVIDLSKTYKCITLIQNFQIDKLPINIIASQTYVVLHCDYQDLDFDFDRNLNYIAVSVSAQNAFKSRFGIECGTILPFMPKSPKKRVYKFISATRLNKAKGLDRMLQLAELFKQKGICYQWIVYCERDITSTSFRCDYPEIIIANAVSNDKMLSYMADADYTIQLSDSEGFCYAVHESLMIGTPCLVTDIPVFENVIGNGFNGYKLPLDMQGIDIDMILNEIPTGFIYYNKTNEAVEQWSDLLKGGSV